MVGRVLASLLQLSTYLSQNKGARKERERERKKKREREREREKKYLYLYLYYLSFTSF